MNRINILILTTFLLFSLFFVSCQQEESNEIIAPAISSHSISSFSLPEIEDEIDLMLYHYVTSTIYLERESLSKQFHNDLNFDGTLDEINTSEKLLDWIGQNIHKTNFFDIVDANSRWDNLAVQRGIEMEQFPEIFEFFSNSSEIEFSEYFNKWFPHQYSSSGSTDCEKNLKSCNDKATKTYKANVEWALSHEGSDRQKEMNCADEQHLNDTNGCKNAFDICMNGEG